jgi:hypothetical protein
VGLCKSKPTKSVTSDRTNPESGPNSPEIEESFGLKSSDSQAKDVEGIYKVVNNVPDLP